MSDKLHRARTYRLRAEELRVMTEDWRHPETLAKLHNLASDYDRMADALERGYDPDMVILDPR
jgi:hypothetical protein